MAISSTETGPSDGSPGLGAFFRNLVIALGIMAAGIVFAVLCAVAVFSALNTVLPDIKLVQAVLVMLHLVW